MTVHNIWGPGQVAKLPHTLTINAIFLPCVCPTLVDELMLHLHNIQEYALFAVCILTGITAEVSRINHHATRFQTDELDFVLSLQVDGRTFRNVKISKF